MGTMCGGVEEGGREGLREGHRGAEDLQGLEGWMGRSVIHQDQREARSLGLGDEENVCGGLWPREGQMVNDRTFFFFFLLG